MLAAYRLSIASGARCTAQNRCKYSPEQKGVDAANTVNLSNGIKARRHAPSSSGKVALDLAPPDKVASDLAPTDKKSSSPSNLSVTGSVSSAGDTGFHQIHLIGKQPVTKRRHTSVGKGCQHLITPLRTRSLGKMDSYHPCRKLVAVPRPLMFRIPSENYESCWRMT